MRRFLALLPVYIGIATLPLLTHTGQNFEYEYVTMVALLALFIIPLWALRTPFHQIPITNSQYGPYLKFEIIWIFVVSPLVALLPGYLAFATRMCSCSFNGFNFWMALQFYPSWILAHATYELILYGRVAGFKIRRLFAGWLLATGLLILNAGVKLWALPQKRTTDLLFGFLHGPIYDARIPIDSGIVLARLSHIVLATMLLLWAWHEQVRGKGKRKVAGVLVGVWLALILLASRYPSVGMGREALERNLKQVLSDQHFAMHVTKKSMETPEHVHMLFLEAKFHVNELRGILGDDAPFVDIYVYPDETSKKLWFGGGATDITDVVTPSIHINDEPLPHTSLRHELVHALSSKLAFHGLGFHPNMALTEGLAVALAPEDGDMGISLDNGVAAMIRDGRMPKINDLFSPLFWRESGPRAYTVAGSLILFLKNNYGVTSVKKLYAGASWEDVFGEDRRNILINWRDQLLRDFDYNLYQLYSDALFKEPGLLKERCPHTKALYKKGRSQSIYVRLQQPIGWDPDQHYLAWLLSLDPTASAARLALWRKEISKLAVQRILPDGRLRTWAEAIHQSRRWPPEHLEDIELAMLESDVLRLTNGRDASTQILGQLADFQKTKFFGNGLIRQVVSRIEIETLLPESEALLWRKYLAGWSNNIPDRLSTEEPWLLKYLRLKRGQINILDKDILQGWLSEGTPPSTLPKTFAVEWYKYLGFRLMQVSSFSAAQKAFTLALQHAPKAAESIIKQYFRQAEFLQAAARHD